MLSIALCMTSCLKDDDTQVTYPNDMVITSFSLSAVNRYVTKTTSAGKDTTTKVKLASGLPVFTIDQYRQLIYNTKPLPAGCDVEHVIASITGKGSFVIKGMNSDSLTFYSNTDSIDFSQPREIRVYALDGSGYRAYQVTVNKQETDNQDILWNEYPSDSPEIPAALHQELLLQKFDSSLFHLSKDGGSTWTDELLGDDEDPSLLPEGNIAWVSFPYAANEDTDYEVMAGFIHDTDSACTVWRKIVEKGNNVAPARWVNIPTENSKKYYLPNMSPLSLIWFDNGLYAIGSLGIIFKSRDGGLTWKPSDDINMPEDIENDHVKAVTSEDGSLWLISTDSGRVWRGKR